MYTKEQAEKDKAEYERMADEAKKRGHHLMAGIYMIKAYNCITRIGMNKAHKPSLGPYSSQNPAYCVDCGMPLKQWDPDDECIPGSRGMLNN